MNQIDKKGQKEMEKNDKKKQQLNHRPQSLHRKIERVT